MYSDQNISLRPCPSKAQVWAAGPWWGLTAARLSGAVILLHQISSPASSSQRCLHGIRFWSVTVVDIKSILSQFFLHENLHHCCCIGNVGSTILIPLKFALIGFKWRQNLISMGVVSGYAKMSSSYGGRYQNLAYLTFFSTLSTYSIFVPTMKHNLRYIYWKITKCTELDENKLKIDP